MKTDYTSIKAVVFDADDTLWSVAKRYGADAAVLAASNGLDGTKKAGDKLTGVKYLLV